MEEHLGFLNMYDIWCFIVSLFVCTEIREYIVAVAPFPQLVQQICPDSLTNALLHISLSSLVIKWLLFTPLLCDSVSHTVRSRWARVIF